MTLLFHHRYKKVSRILFYFCFLYGFVYLIFLEGNETLEEWFTFKVPAFISKDFFSKLEIGWHWVDTMFMDEALSVFLVLSGIFAGFSKEKHEDELIDKMRNDSLRWSLFINYGILLLTLLGVYGAIYLNFMFAQLFLILLLFNLIFDIKLYRHYKSGRNEE